jgi:hypothetical protein
MLLAYTERRRLYPHRKQAQVPKVEAHEFLQLLVPVLAYKDLCHASLLVLLQPCHRKLQRLNLPLLGIYCVLYRGQNTIEQVQGGISPDGPAHAATPSSCPDCKR